MTTPREQNMGELAIRKGVEVYQPIRPLPKYIRSTFLHGCTTTYITTTYITINFLNIIIPFFMGSTSEEPHGHLTRFLQLWVSMRLPNINEEHTKLILFPFSLGGNSTTWLNSHSNHSLTTQGEVKEKFLNYSFPETRVEAIRENIVNFRQFATESLFDVWEKYKALLRSYPSHGYSRYSEISMFLKWITHEYRRMVNFVGKGNFLNKTLTEVKKIIKDLAASEQNLDYGRATFQKGMYEMSSQDNLLATQQKMQLQLDTITKQIQQLPKQLQSMHNTSHKVFNCEQ